MTKVQPSTFDEASERIAQIVEAVSDADAPLESLLELFDEAASLGLAASDLMNRDITVPTEGAGDVPEGGGEPGDEPGAEEVVA